LSAQVTVLKKYKNVPVDETEENMKGKVLFAVIQTEGFSFMISDKQAKQIHQGNTVELSIACSSDSMALQVFEALSDGGLVTHPIVRQEWGSTNMYGQLVDRFGVSWSIFSEPE
jgi:PhnB protein